MPTVFSPAVLSAVYEQTLRNAAAAPTTIVWPDTTIFRAFDQRYFTVDTYRHILRRDQADNALIVRDAVSDENRWTGLSHDARITPWGGLYCSLQQQAIVNEVAHYVQADRVKAALASSRPIPKPAPRSAVLSTKCVIKIRVLGSIIAVDLSPHNALARSFVKAIAHAPSVQKAISAAGRSWRGVEAINDSDDCSVARGIGLALANYGYRALIVQTARDSERSPFEKGDNLVFFGHQNERIANLSAVEAYLFPTAGGGLDGPLSPAYPQSGKPVVYPVEF